ncbi:MAG: insulinase family protein [Clostridia bacterium]|nr:insulinase family protein [Clostridia bacterium]
MQIKNISKGIEGCYVKTPKFKTSRISINMFVKADEKEVSAYSLLQQILVRTTKDYPDFTSLNKYLKELYGANLSGEIQKYGDVRVLRFVISFINDNYTINGEKISEKATDLLLSAIFDPALENGHFKNDEIESNKRLLIDEIESELNNKRLYAVSNTSKIMYEDEPAGIPLNGTVETVKKLTDEDLIFAHKKLLEEAFVRVNVISENEPDDIYNKIVDRFETVNRNVEKVNVSKPHIAKEQPKIVEEQMDVTQGKLCLGFAIDSDNTLNDYIVSQVFVNLYGGAPFSKLFVNVREKQSLCYYCAARLDYKKSTFMVDSGILEENKNKAYDGILEQLEEMKKGNFTDDDINASKMALSDTVVAISDIIGDVDFWYLKHCFDNLKSVEDFLDKINKVTKEDIVNKANTVKLDTVYFLGGLKGDNA